LKKIIEEDDGDVNQPAIQKHFLIFLFPIITSGIKS